MKNSIVVFISIFLFHSIFIYLDDGSGIGRRIQAGCTILPLLFVFSKIRYFFSIKKVNVAVLLYCLLLLVTSILSKSIDISYLHSSGIDGGEDYKSTSYSVGILYAINFLMLFTYVNYFTKIGKIHILFDTFFKISLFYVVITDLIFIVVGNIFFEGYLIGNKFNVSYLHIFCAIFFCMKGLYSRGSYNKLTFYFLLMFALVISIVVQCTTALLGCIIVFCMFFYKSYFKRKIYNVWVFIVILAFCSSFFFLFSFALENPIIQYVIVDVLGKDPTLSYRTVIYSGIGESLTLRPLWGFGVENAHSILRFSLGFANAQNGILNLLLEQGIFGVVSFLFLLITILKYNNNKNTYNRKLSYPLLVYILMYIIISSVEITFNSSFIALLLLLPAYNTKNKHLNNKSANHKNIVSQNEYTQS